MKKKFIAWLARRNRPIKVKMPDGRLLTAIVTNYHFDRFFKFKPWLAYLYHDGSGWQDGGMARRNEFVYSGVKQ